MKVGKLKGVSDICGNEALWKKNECLFCLLSVAAMNEGRHPEG
jgi:hypothetical protein